MKNAFVNASEGGQAMLWRAGEIRGYKILAKDGGIGSADDLLFDDARWTVRYLVVDTGGWLHDRKVLLIPSALGHPDGMSRHFPVDLTKEQVENSPDIDTDRPISRQRELELHHYYGWAPYWGMPGLLAGAPGAVVAPLPIDAVTGRPGATENPAEREAMQAAREQGDLHLRSTREVSGYDIHAADGHIGHVEDFLVDDDDWTIRYLIVDTRNWLPGKKVLVSPQWIRAIQWEEREVEVDLTKDEIKHGPEYDPEIEMDRSFEERLYGHYGRTPYWR